MGLYDELKNLSDISFRDIYHRFIYIHCRELLLEIMPEEINDSITGAIAYCYIDRTEGISFRFLMTAIMNPDSLQVFEYSHWSDTIIIMRFRDGKVKMDEMHHNNTSLYLYALDPKKYEYIDLSVVNFNLDDFKGIKDLVDNQYYAGDMVEEFRSDRFTALDKYRHEWYPDDVKVILFEEGKEPETVWVRLTGITPDEELFGELLNEPYQDFGFHEGAFIEITEINHEGDSFLVFTGRVGNKKAEE